LSSEELDSDEEMDEMVMCTDDNYDDMIVSNNSDNKHNDVDFYDEGAAFQKAVLANLFEFRRQREEEKRRTIRLAIRGALLTMKINVQFVTVPLCSFADFKKLPTRNNKSDKKQREHSHIRAKNLKAIR